MTRRTITRRFLLWLSTALDPLTEWAFADDMPRAEPEWPRAGTPVACLPCDAPATGNVYSRPLAGRYAAMPSCRTHAMRCGQDWGSA